MDNKPKGLAIAGMSCGIVSLLLACSMGLGLPVAIVGAVLSGMARKKIAAGEASGSGFATAGLVTSIIGLVLNAIWVVYIIWFASYAGSFWYLF